MKDTLVRAVACNRKVRVLACTTTNLCEEARKLHDLWPTSAAALGRVLSMAAMMGCMEKEDKHKVTIQINGGGPIGTVMADGCGNGDVRGFVADPHQYLKYNDTNKLAVGVVVGTDGYLKVTRNIGMKENFTSQIKLVSGEIGDDFAYYYTVSEQTPSAVSVGVLVDVDNSVKSAGGLIIQIMPDALEEDIVKAEKAVANLKPVSTMVDEGMDAVMIAQSLFDDLEILDQKDLHWHCGCSRERFKAALTTLPKEDLLEMLNNDHGCEATCEYCNTSYQFDEEDLKLILEFKEACGK